MSINVKALKISMLCSLSFSALFGLVSLVLYFGEWERLLLVCLFGFFIGFVAAPEFEPKAFKKAWLLQLSGGVIAGLLVGLIFGLNNENIVAVALIGGFIGWTAPYWIKHVPIP
jgi:hypothetical protein